MSIAENVAAIRSKMDEAAIACGRDPKEILLCAATKMNDASAVRQAIAAGVDCCGENRAQELTAKLRENAYHGKPVHFIGRLQTNKVKQVVGKVDLIQSVDRENLLEAIQKEAARQGIIQDILLEVNIGGEESKSGFAPDEVYAAAEHALTLPHVRVLGLMTIPPVEREEHGNLAYFREVRRLYVDINNNLYHNSFVYLSMGMSDDFEDAIAAGATMIRVGSAIFGQRHYQ